MTRSAIEAGKAFVRISLEGKASVDRDIRDLQMRLKATASLLRSYGTSVAKTFGLISSTIAAGTTVAFGSAIKAAGSFAGDVSKFEVVFGKQQQAVRSWAREYSKLVGRSEAQTVQFLATAQDTFVPLGFDPKEAEQLSKTVTKLAVDLASFNNQSDDESFQRLISALVGNTENLRAFGVVAQDAQIKAKALQLGFDPKNLTAQQKATTILNLAIAGTAAAQGDAQRTSATAPDASIKNGLLLISSDSRKRNL